MASKMMFGERMIEGARGHLEAIRRGGPVRQRVPAVDGTFIRAVAVVDSGMWVVQGLERDIGAQGSSLAEAMANFMLAMAAELDERGGTLNNIGPAPQWFFHMWDNAPSP